MRFASFTVLAALLSAAIAQSLAPSPSNSIGCVPHDDHWHCDGPKVTPVPVGSASASAVAITSSAHFDHDDHGDAAGTGSLAPSPIGSVGCEPHGDHWHCTGPRTAGAAAVSGASSSSRSAPAQQSVNGAAQQTMGAAMMLAVAGYAMAI